MSRPKTLTAAFVKSVCVPGRYGDGRGSHGLSLLVKPTVNGRWSKTWGQRLRIGGRITTLGLGSYPVVSLAEARRRALVNRQAVEAGKDPRSGGVPTFEQATHTVIALHGQGWRDRGRSEAQWHASLRDYAYPVMGSKAVDKITTADVLAVLAPIWHAKPETARRVRQRIGAVMRWAVAEGHRQDNPAGDAIAAALPKHSDRRQHHLALPHDKVGTAVAAVRASDAYAATKLAFEFLVLTAARSGEVRGARWGEIDLDAAVWTIPAERTKTARAHRVPLSRRAIEVLTQARSHDDGEQLVFASASGVVMSGSTMSKLARELGLGMAPHGARASFRSWCADTAVPREVAEACLAHVVKGVEGAYQRSDLLTARAQIMQQWADYLTETQTNS